MKKKEEIIAYIKEGDTGIAEYFYANKVNDDYLLVNDPGNDCIYHE